MDNIRIGIQIVIALSAVIFVHELGHFIVARWRKIRVETFSLGMGPKILGFKRGDTDYVISLVPIGGFCKMAGEEPEDGRKYKKWEFFGQPWWSKILVVIFGPIMNFFFAYFILVFISLYGVNIPVVSNVISVVEKGSIAEQAGFKAGDVINKINGKGISTWNDFEDIVYKNETTCEVSVLRNAKAEINIKVLAPKDKPLGISPERPAVIEVATGQPAYNAGLKSKDRIISIDKKPIKNWYEVASAVSESNGKKLSIRVKRGNETIIKEITPKQIDPESKRFFIGISPRAETSVKQNFGFFESLDRGLYQLVTLTKLQLKGLWMLVSGKLNVKESISGPIMIVKVAADFAEKGFIDFIFWFAVISLALGIMNLMPLPVVDGGMMVVFLIEGIMGKMFPVKFYKVFMTIGWVFIIVLSIFVAFNDTFKLIFKT